MNQNKTAYISVYKGCQKIKAIKTGFSSYEIDLLQFEHKFFSDRNECKSDGDKMFNAGQRFGYNNNNKKDSILQLD